MSERISFEPDLTSLSIADRLSAQTGATLEEIAAEAFSAYCEGVREMWRHDVDSPEWKS